MLENFACVVVIAALVCVFGYILFLMWQFLEKSITAIELDDDLPEQPSPEEKKRVVASVEEALKYYDRLGYISKSSTGEMAAYKRMLDEIYAKNTIEGS